jgi:hypothetical protein
MTFQEWRPQTRRNKIALGFALFSFLLMIGWNLAPMYNGPFGLQTYQGIVAVNVWPGIYDDTMQSLTDYDIDNMPGLIAGFCLVLLIFLQLTITPLWRIFSQSKLLRYIPAVICLIGFGICAYYCLPNNYDTWHEIYPLYLITINLLTTSIALILLKYEAVV